MPTSQQSDDKGWQSGDPRGREYRREAGQQAALDEAGG